MASVSSGPAMLDLMLVSRRDCTDYRGNNLAEERRMLLNVPNVTSLEGRPSYLYKIGARSATELGENVFVVTMVLGRTPIHANDVACTPDEVELVRYGQQKLISLENGSPYVCMSYSPPAPWYASTNGDRSMQQEISTTRPIFSPRAKKIILGDYHHH